ncbi:hypothetical protein D3C81_2177740 [compost metagenome]
MRQRRTGQGIERFTTGYAAIALQAMGLAVAVEVCRQTCRTMQLRLRCLLDQEDGRILWRAGAQ